MDFSNKLFSLLISTVMFFSGAAYAQQGFDLFELPRNTVIVSPYDYPITNPYSATLSFIAARPTKNIEYKLLQISLHPERAALPFYGKDYLVKLAFFKHENNPNAPLVFIAPGLGGSALRPSSLYLGEILYNAGYNVVTLPSTLSWQFAIGVSRTGYPGFSAMDAEDMLTLMKKVDTQLRIKENINPNKYALLGFSLGALDSSFIVNLDLQNHFFNFERVLMLNPPIQKDKSITTLDGLMITNPANFVLKLIDSSIFSLDKVIQFNFDNQIELADPEMKWIIGSNFRNSLREVILVSQEIDDQGILKTSTDPLLRGLRKAEAGTFNFRSYINRFLFAKMKKNNDSNFNFNNPSELVNRSDMRTQLTSLSQHNVKWAIFHNQNDFIFNEGDLEILLNSNSNSRIYPLGGHLGNLWFAQNRYDILTFFAPLKQ